MAKSFGITAIAIFAGFTFTASTANAAGFGGYLEYGHTATSVEYDDLDADVDYDSNRIGVGFLFDTNLAKDRLFNYRLRVGYQHSDTEYDGGFDESANGFLLSNTFGFGILRNQHVRLWAGPEVRLTVDVEEVNRPDVTTVDFGFGGGPALGLNWHIPNTPLTLTGSLSYNFLAVVSVIDYEDNPFGDDEDSGVGRQHLIGFNVGLAYRTASDRFEP